MPAMSSLRIKLSPTSTAPTPCGGEFVHVVFGTMHRVRLNDKTMNIIVVTVLVLSLIVGVMLLIAQTCGGFSHLK